MPLCHHGGGQFLQNARRMCDVNYVKRKPLTFAYPNEKLTSYILERWPEKYVCIRVRMCAREDRGPVSAHNPTRLRFFFPFDVLRDLRISARHSPRWILYYLLRSCTDTWTVDVSHCKLNPLLIHPLLIQVHGVRKSYCNPKLMILDTFC